MRRLILIIITLLMVSCDNLNLNLNKDKEDSKPKANNVYTDIISDSILKDSNTETNDQDITVLESTETPEKTESKGTVALNQETTPKDEVTPQVDEVTMNNEVKVNEDIQNKVSQIDTQNMIKKQPSSVSQQIPVEESLMENNSMKSVQTKKVKQTDNSSSMIIIGNDGIGQGLSPRSYIHMSFAVFENSTASQFIEFQVYAVPINSRLRRTGYYLLGYNTFARIIKGQAQFTRYWNGKNTRGQFLPKGKYNVYLWYKVKNKNGKVLYTAGRYWGNSRKYYLNLY